MRPDWDNYFIEIAKADNVIGEEINIATQTEISILNLTKNLIEIINPKSVVVTEDDRIRPEKSEVERLLGDNTKIKALTRWTPRVTLEQGLRETVEWFSKTENLNRYKSKIYNI